MNYKISVIIPVYNVEQYLKRCLDSLLAQTLKEIELIIVNDGSTDNSQEIINKYVLENENIKSFEKENGGLSDARNFGIKKSKGEYLAFVDSDDWVKPEMFKVMYNLAKKNSSEIVFCNLQKVDEKGRIIKLLEQQPQLAEKINLIEDFSIFGEMSCFACNKIFKRELFSNIEFTKGIYFEDISTIPRLVLKSKIISKTNEYFYQYFERTGSISKSYTEKGLDIFKAINIIKENFQLSEYNEKIKDWKKFVILQGYYSFLAYYAYVPNDKLKINMFNELRNIINKENIRKKDIFLLKRHKVVYLFSLNWKKQIYYLFNLIKL